LTSKSAKSLRHKANLRLKVQKLRAHLPLRTPKTTTMTTSSRPIPASMISAVVSVLMLLACKALVLMEPLVVVQLAVDKPKPPHLEDCSNNKDSAKARPKPPVPTLPAADQPAIMPELPKLTVPAMTATTPPSLLLTVLPLLPLPLEALLPVLVVAASMPNVPKLTAPALTVTTPPLPLLTLLPLLLVLLKVPAETLHSARDSVPDVLMPSVPDKPALLLTAETLPLLALTLSDLKDLPPQSLPVVTAFSTANPSVELLSPSAAATQSVLPPTKSTPTAEMLLLLVHTNFPLPPVTGTVSSLANTVPLLSAPLLSSRQLLTFSRLVSLVTATSVLPTPTAMFLRFVNPLSNKRLLCLPQLLAQATSHTDTLLTPTLVSTEEPKLVTVSVEEEPMVLKVTARATDMVNSTDGEREVTSTLEKLLNLYGRSRFY